MIYLQYFPEMYKTVYSRNDSDTFTHKPGHSKMATISKLKLDLKVNIIKRTTIHTIQNTIEVLIESEY